MRLPINFYFQRRISISRGRVGTPIDHRYLVCAGLLSRSGVSQCDQEAGVIRPWPSAHLVKANSICPISTCRRALPVTSRSRRVSDGPLHASISADATLSHLAPPYVNTTCVGTRFSRAIRCFYNALHALTSWKTSCRAWRSRFQTEIGIGSSHRQARPGLCGRTQQRRCVGDPHPIEKKGSMLHSDTRPSKEYRSRSVGHCGICSLFVHLHAESNPGTHLG